MEILVENVVNLFRKDNMKLKMLCAYAIFRVSRFVHKVKNYNLKTRNYIKECFQCFIYMSNKYHVLVTPVSISFTVQFNDTINKYIIKKISYLILQTSLSDEIKQRY